MEEYEEDCIIFDFEKDNEYKDDDHKDDDDDYCKAQYYTEGKASLSTEEIKLIVDRIAADGVKFNEKLLNFFLRRCKSNSLNTEEVKKVFKIMEDDIVFDSRRIKDGSGYSNLFKNFLAVCKKGSLDTECVIQIFDRIGNNIVFHSRDCGNSLIEFLAVCEKGSLNEKCVKMFLEKIWSYYKFDSSELANFLNACGETSLNDENLENLYHSCHKNLFEDFWKGNVNFRLNSDTSKRLFQKLCNFYEKEEELPKRKAKNKKLGILGSIGVTFGGLFGFVAIGLGTAVGIGALAVTIAAPIAVVGLALLGIFGYLTDRFRVNKVLNEIEEGKLNEKKVNENEIPFDLRKRKEIQNALDEANNQLLENGEMEII